MQGFEQSKRRFVTAGISSFITVSAFIGTFNVWVDPFDVFRAHYRAETQRTERYYEANDERLWQLRAMALQAEDGPEDVLLIGPSQLLYSFDVCGLPSIDKLSLFSLNDGEMEAVIRSVAAMQHRPMTYLINAGVSGSTVQLPRTRNLTSLRHYLFSWRVTSVSLSSYAARFRPHSTCEARNFRPREDMSPQAVKERLFRAKAAGYSVDQLAGSLAAIGATCSRWQSSVVVFTLPVYFRPEDVGSLRALEADLSAKIAPAIHNFNQQHPNCHAEFADEATAYTVAHALQGAPENEWLDATHFKPVLGENILHSILNRPR